MSVVRRVTSDELENWSMLANEKRCTAAKTSWRRFMASPHEAWLHVMPAPMPKASDASAMSTSAPAKGSRAPIVAPAWMVLMSCAVTKGIATSMTTSPETMMGVAIEAPLNSRTLLPSVRITSRPLIPLLFSVVFFCMSLLSTRGHFETVDGRMQGTLRLFFSALQNAHGAAGRRCWRLLGRLPQGAARG